MINYLNIPVEALINTPISKKLFAEKTSLSAVEKRVLREDVETLTMKGLLQTRTVGLAIYSDDEYLYDQIIVAEAKIRNRTKVSTVAAMIQRAFPVPMFLLLQSDGECGINWCVKRINQADKSKRVIEKQRITRFFAEDGSDLILKQWLCSLDVSKIKCSTLKDLFDELCHRLIMLEVSDEAGSFIEADKHKIEQHWLILAQLAANREEQRRASTELKSEAQFNARLKLTLKLKELQLTESQIKKELK